MLDVVVDLRRGSPWYGQYISIELSAENWAQLWVPVGFAHGFCTLEPDTAVIYKVSTPFSAEHDSGIFWNDPDLKIDWPVAEGNAILSEKDASLQAFRDFDTPFSYEGQS
jgi:dTDP-4-dehydrorhamnose 3,5-epimerase